MWAWALVAGGGIAAFLWWRGKNAAPKTGSDTGCPSGQVDSNGNCVEQPDQQSIAIVPVPTPGGTTGGTTGPTGTPGVSSYVVKHGDTWASIAKRLHTTPQDLYYFQFSSAGVTKNSQAFRIKIAEHGPNSIASGNIIAYPTSGTYPKYAGFTYWTNSSHFWQGGKDKSKAKPVK